MMDNNLNSNNFHKLSNMAELPIDILNKYLINCEKRIAKKKEILFEPTQAPDYIYMVLRGKVRVFLTYYDGKEFTVTILEKGGVYSGHARGYGMAITKDAEIALIHVSLFQQIMIENPEFMLSVMAILGDALKNTVNIIENLAFREVDERLKHFLSQVVIRSGKAKHQEILIDIGLTQEEIASAIGSSRQTVSSQLKQLENKGILSIKKRKVTILKPNYFDIGHE